MARHLAIIAALFALAGPTIAGDGFARSNQVAENDWTGAYVGGHFGAAWGGFEWTSVAPNFQIGGTVGLGNPFDFSTGTGSYFQGLQAGYNYQLPSGFLLGAQVDLSFPNLLAGTQTIAAAGADIADYESKYCSQVRCVADWLCVRAPARLWDWRVRTGAG